MTFEKILDLAPTKENRRNSEGDFILLKDGSILFVYSRYGAGDGDGDAADLYAIRSSDGGRSFSEPRLLVSRASCGADNLMSVTLRRMKNGDLGLFFLKKSAPCQCRLFLMRSPDEGKTFSAPVACIPHRGYFVVNNDRVILTGDGTWLAPAACTGVLIDDETGESSFGRAYFIVYASDDDGATWYKKGETHPAGGFERSRTGLQEPGLLELSDGTLWAWFRTDTGWQYESFSRDGGASWSALPSPRRPLRLPPNGFRTGRSLRSGTPFRSRITAATAPFATASGPAGARPWSQREASTTGKPSPLPRSWRTIPIWATPTPRFWSSPTGRRFSATAPDRKATEGC